MRKEFVKRLYESMEETGDIWLITADLGFGLFDKIREDFPDRFLNTGASEQAASDICVGLALSGKIPFMYTITPFYYRCWETLRTYLNAENINVKMIGSGRDRDYHTEGISHFSEDIKEHLNCLPNIAQYWPETNEAASIDLDIMLSRNQPCFISLRK